MAVRINTEFNYRNLVEGETIWYKIKTLKGFLENRELALRGKKVAELRLKAKKAKLLQDSSLNEWEKLELEAEILEIENNKSIEDEAYALCEKEIETLKKLLEEYYEIAEPLRIEGFSDDEMIEATAGDEFCMKLIKEMKANVIATGTVPPELIQRALKAPREIQQVLQQNNLLPQGDLKCLV